MKKITKW